jgi:hypothetical protein
MDSEPKFILTIPPGFVIVAAALIIAGCVAVKWANHAWPDAQPCKCQEVK